MHHYLLTLINIAGPLCTIQRLKPMRETASIFGLSSNLRRNNKGRKLGYHATEEAGAFTRPP